MKLDLKKVSKKSLRKMLPTTYSRLASLLKPGVKPGLLKDVMSEAGKEYYKEEMYKGSMNDQVLGCYFKALGEQLDTEVAWAVYLDASLQVIQHEEISRGTMHDCAVDMQKIMRSAVSSKAVFAVLVHNHPSGDTEFSKADVQAAKKLYFNLKLINVTLIDHIVVGNNSVNPNSIYRKGEIDKFHKEYTDKIKPLTA